MTSFLSGVSPDCIRAWERRYNAITPERDNGRRVFKDSDVTRLQMLKELSSLGNPISSVARMNDEELYKLCNELGINLKQKTQSAPQDNLNPKDILDLMMVAFDSKRFDVFLHELNKASEEFTNKTFAMEIGSKVAERLLPMNFPEKKALGEVFKGVLYKKLFSRQEQGDHSAIVTYIPGTENEILSLLSGLILSENGFKIVSVTGFTDMQAITKTAQYTSSKLIFLEAPQEYKTRAKAIMEQFNTQDWKGDFILSCLHDQSSVVASLYQTGEMLKKFSHDL